MSNEHQTGHNAQPSIGETAKNAIDKAKQAQAAGAGPAAPAATVPAVKKASPKSKESLGIPTANIVTWVPADFTPEQNNLLARAARTREVKVADILRDLVKTAFNDTKFQATLAEDAAKAPEQKSTTKLPDDPNAQLQILEKRAANAQKMQDRANAAIEAARARLAAMKAAGAAATTA